MATPVRPSISLESHSILAIEEYANELGIGHELGLMPEAVKGRLDVHSIWIETPLTDGWIAAFRIFVKFGMPLVGEIRIFPNESQSGRSHGEWSAAYLGSRAQVPGTGITMPLLRRIKLGLVRQAMSDAVKHLQRDPLWSRFMSGIGFAVDSVRDPSGRKSKSEKRGRPSLPDTEYALLAAYYVDSCKRSSSPVQETAEHFHISSAVARTRLHEARKRGLLSKGSRGLTGGQLSQEAVGILSKLKGKTMRKEHK